MKTPRCPGPHVSAPSRVMRWPPEYSLTPTLRHSALEETREHQHVKPTRATGTPDTTSQPGETGPLFSCTLGLLLSTMLPLPDQPKTSLLRIWGASRPTCGCLGRPDASHSRAKVHSPLRPHFPCVLCLVVEAGKYFLELWGRKTIICQLPSRNR